MYARPGGSRFSAAPFSAKRNSAVRRLLRMRSDLPRAPEFAKLINFIAYHLLVYSLVNFCLIYYQLNLRKQASSRREVSPTLICEYFIFDSMRGEPFPGSVVIVASMNSHRVRSNDSDPFVPLILNVNPSQTKRSLEAAFSAKTAAEKTRSAVFSRETFRSRLQIALGFPTKSRTS